MLYKSINKIAGGVFVSALLTWTAAVAPLNAQTESPKTARQNLDENLAGVEVKAVSRIMATALKLDKAVVEKAMFGMGYKSSELVLAKAMAEKKAQPISRIISDMAGCDWLAELKQAGLTNDDIVLRLDEANAEVSFLLMDVPAKQKNKRLSQK